MHGINPGVDSEAESRGGSEYTVLLTFSFFLFTTAYKTSLMGFSPPQQCFDIYTLLSPRHTHPHHRRGYLNNIEDDFYTGGGVGVGGQVKTLYTPKLNIVADVGVWSSDVNESNFAHFNGESKASASSHLQMCIAAIAEEGL